MGESGLLSQGDPEFSTGIYYIPLPNCQCVGTVGKIAPYQLQRRVWTAFYLDVSAHQLNQLKCMGLCCGTVQLPGGHVGYIKR